MHDAGTLRPTLALLVWLGWSPCVGCSGPAEHPPAAVQTSAEGDVAEAESTGHDAVEVAAGIARANACTPGSARGCRYYFMLNGQQQCPMRTQLCRADGTDWLPCGQAAEGE
jgi:hypothetical protein